MMRMNLSFFQAILSLLMPKNIGKNLRNLIAESDEQVQTQMSDVVQFRQPRLTLTSLRVFPLLYLATPFRDYPGGWEKAYEDAATIAGRLAINGVSVFSPICHGHGMAKHGGLNPIDHSLWTRINKPFIKMSSGLIIAEMETWKISKGIKEESDEFAKDGKPIYYVNPNSLAIRQ